MFTGLVKEVGKIEQISKNTEGFLLKVQCPLLWPHLSIDDSLSVEGACQTIIAKETNNTVVMQTVHATLEKTSFKSFKTGQEVNLEDAVTLSSPLGGHLVSGHVNDVAKIVDIKSTGKNFIVSLSVKFENLKYCIKEGSICLNGVSLTIYDIDDSRRIIKVSIIPHTWNVTTFKFKKIGDFVNVEFDLISKYVERMLNFKK
jgi:riboflavin synthase